MILRFAPHVVVLLALSLSPAARALTCSDIDGAYILSQESSATYLGFFGSVYAADSVENPYGQFGSQYQSASIRNPYGNYGSQYAQYSVANPFSLTPPIVFRSGQPIFYLTTNATLGGVSLAQIDEACGTNSFVATEPDTDSSSAPPVNLDQHGLSGTWSEDGVGGQGFALEIAPDLFGPGVGNLFAGWFAYSLNPAAGQRWYTIQGQVRAYDAFLTLPVYATTGGSFEAAVEPVTAQVGIATIKFLDCAHAIVSYDLQDEVPRAGFIGLTRATVNGNCSPGGDVGSTSSPTGIWASSSASGQGFALDFDTTQQLLFGGWFTYAAGAAANAGLGGQRWLTLQSPYHAGQTTLSTVSIYETTGGTFGTPGGTSTAQVGTAKLVLHDCQSATLTYQFNADSYGGSGGTAELTRVTPAPSNCSL